MDCIARDNNISATTIGRWLDTNPELYPVFPDSLPEHLAFDEVRGVHRKLHFICIDGSNDHQIIKVLPVLLNLPINRICQRGKITLELLVLSNNSKVIFFDIISNKLYKYI